ncbi:hypothetical protein AB0G79_11315 [Streptomyces sp. NPDC020807]|uniref:hypothetical protein n=1 Tax=Streptomyces sp. NPDC020807 TaxID=3155119 RepID=UPI0033F024FC
MRRWVTERPVRVVVAMPADRSAAACAEAVVYAAGACRRVGAVANLEGYLDLDPYPAPVGSGTPLLLFRTDGFEGAARIEASWAGVPGRRALLAGANHWTFTDYGTLVPQLRSAGLVTAAARAALVGSGGAAVGLAEVRRRVGSFFARHLGCRGTGGAPRRSGVAHAEIERVA